MISLSLAPGSFLFFIFILFLFTIFILIAYYFLLFLRLPLYKEKPPEKNIFGVSVVICARNAYLSLKENLPSILEQDYPDFEVILVNYASDDESDVLLTNMTDQYPMLKIVEIKENLNFFSGKKFPLSIGIKSARHDLIVVTEPDCRPSSRNWLTLMVSGFTSDTEVILGYGSYEKRKGILNKLIRYDTVQKAILYLSSSLAGIPYMGVGRNMAYRRSLFFKNKGFTSHYHLK